MEMSIAVVIFILILLGVCIARGILFEAKFSKIELGMSYKQVISITGLSHSSDFAGDTTTCIWSIRPLTVWHITKVVVFKNDKVISILDH